MTMQEMITFQPWPKIGRINTTPQVQITEKIDGTNACVIIQDGCVVGTQSRNRMITPGDDNAGFAQWAHANRDILPTVLGDGYHYGEWAGPTIQKNPMGLKAKKFFLFDPRRYDPHLISMAGTVVGDLGTVPILYEGPFFTDLIERVMFDLSINARMRGYEAEGIVTWWSPFRTLTKTTFKHSEGKWRVEAVEAAA